MEVIGHYNIIEEIPTNSPKEAVLEFLKLYPNAQITYVHGGLLNTICNGCCRPIYDGEAHQSLEDATLCQECAIDLEDCVDDEDGTDE